MPKNLSVGERITLRAEGRNDEGQAASLTTPPTWMDDPPGVVTLRRSPDGILCQITGAAIGESTITVTSGAASGTYDVAVIPGTATQVAIIEVTP